MLYAELRRTGKIIPADKATYHGDYRCPICRGEVGLRAGSVYVAHFYHKQGHGKKECEEYHPPEHLRRQWETPAAASSAHRIDPLILSIELEPERQGRRGGRRWALRITVPRSFDTHGDIRIDLGGGDVRRLTLATMSLGAQTFGADPSAPEFGAAWVSPEVRPAYRQAVEHRIAGLAVDGVTVFSAVPHKLKPRTTTMRWGESYYLIWKRERELSFPDSLLRHELGDHRGWSCCLVVLPDNAPPEVATWLEHTCDVPIAAPRREWAFAYPPPYGVDDDGNIKVHSATPALLAIKPGENETGEITCVSGQHVASLQASGLAPQVIAVTVQEDTQRRPIYLAWDQLPLNSLTVQAYPPAIAEPAVVLEFAQGASKSQAGMHHARCREFLSRVRHGDDRVEVVRMETGVRGNLKSRLAGAFEWFDEVLSVATRTAIAEPIALPRELIDRLNAVLKNRTLDVSLDFGPYGGFHADGARAVAPVGREYRLSRHLRQRIAWLSKTSGYFVDEACRPLSALDDAALVRHMSVISVPPALEPHQRALARDLRRLNLHDGTAL
jgi:hypothetical protein